jgi:DNA excision repair protein ERCC-5
MEAEAQCAELLSRGLVDGLITDDSDVFLFGGSRVYRHFFNQARYVECYLVEDLWRELGLDREKLVRLAYLLGSDYTDGLPGVGPVAAMEIMNEFSGEDGLRSFKQWWTRVQRGRDVPEDNGSPFRRKFVRLSLCLSLVSLQLTLGFIK